MAETLGKVLRHFHNWKKRHTKERERQTQHSRHTHRQTDARSAVGGSLYIHLSMYTRPTLVVMTCQKFCSVARG
jgi:hypothetical protein